MAMDWNRIEGQLEAIQGRGQGEVGQAHRRRSQCDRRPREQLEGKLQQRYGFAKDQIHKDVDDWFRTLK